MRQRRLVFGEDAELYDRIRPSYPENLVDDVVALAGPAARTVDVACGTGRAALLLASRGLTGVGVEPDPAMATVARRHLGPWPGWRVEVDEFEAWEPAASWSPADLVTCAQGWHWLQPEVRFAKAHRLLRPGGWLALWWNHHDHDPSTIAEELAAVYAEHAPGLRAGGPGSRGGLGTGLSAGPVPFGVPRRRTYRWSRSYRTRDWTDLLRTQSDHRLLPPEHLERLLSAVAQVLDRHGGTYLHPYASVLWAAQALVGTDR